MDKIAAVWARISTSDQTSLPDQIARAKEKLESLGYRVLPDRILAVDWTSLDLFNCPEFQQLYSWVKRKEIHAVGMLDRDRLQAEPTQRLAFLAECKEAEVEWVLCQGPPMIEGDMGVLMEHILVISKKQQVMRAKLGARDGLHDRVTIDRKPTSRHKVFGYKWETDTKLMPNEDWPTSKIILDMSLSGATYTAIQRELKKRAILSARGLNVWDISSIAFIIHNPTYAGRYYALKRLVMEPKKRIGNTYGNTSARNVPLDEAIYLSEVDIINPPITWEQYQQIQARHEKNKELALRNADVDYLLRGFVFCETHRGKRGGPRQYYGRAYNDSYIYTCPVGGCAHPNLNGPELENRTKQLVRSLLSLEPHDFYEQIVNKENQKEAQKSLNRELKSLKVKHNRNINAETELENRSLMGMVHPEVYQRLKSKYQAERIWIEERVGVINDEVVQLNREGEAIASLQQIKDRFSGRLNELTNAEWCEIFIALNLQIFVSNHDEPDNPYLRLSSPDVTINYLKGKRDFQELQMRQLESAHVEVRIGLPLESTREQVSNIVFNGPWPALSADRHILYAIDSKSAG